MWRHDRDYFMYAPSQWELTLHNNVDSHWMGVYRKWSLRDGNLDVCPSKGMSVCLHNDPRYLLRHISHPENYTIRFTLCCVLLWFRFGQPYPYASGLLHWDRRNLTTKRRLKPFTRYIFYIRNIKIYLQFMSFLHTDMTRLPEIFPHVRQGLVWEKVDILIYPSCAETLYITG